MSKSSPHVPFEGNLDEYLAQILRDLEKNDRLNDESIDAIERLAKPVEGEAEFKERMLKRISFSQSGSDAQTLGEYIKSSRGQVSLQELGRRLNVSPSFLRDLESDQVRLEGFVSAYAPHRLARLIVELGLDVDHFIKLMFVQPPAPGAISLSRTAGGITEKERTQIQDQVQASSNKRLSSEDSRVQSYLQQLRTEVQQLTQGGGTRII